MATSQEMMNGNISPTDGVESFTVIDYEKQANNRGEDDAYHLDTSFVFNNLITLPVDDLAERVKELSVENQQLKECMDRSNTAMKDINARISKKFQELRVQNVDLKSENKLLMSRVVELETDAEQLEHDLNSERERSQSLSREIQLVKASEESELQTDVPDSLLEANQQLAAELSSAKASLDELLIDMQNVQKLKSDAEEQCETMYAENKTLREQLAKVSELRSKIMIEKREVLEMNVQLEREVEEMRRLTENLDKLPISLMYSNFPKLLDKDDEKTENSTSSGDQKEEEICSTDAGPPSLEHDIDEDLTDSKIAVCTEDSLSDVSCHKSTSTVDCHIASIDKEEVQRLLMDESLITTEGRRVLCAKIDVLLNELTAREQQCAELTSELASLRIEFESRKESVVEKPPYPENIAVSAKDDHYPMSYIADLQMEISELREQIADQKLKETSVQSSLTQEVTSVICEKTELAEKPHHSESTAATAKDEANQYELRIADLQMEISELRKQIADQATECKEFKETSVQQSSLTQEVTPVMRDSASDDSSMSSLDKTQMHQLRNRCKSVEKENNSLKNSKKQAEQTHKAVIAASNEHTNMLKNEVRKLENEIAWLRADHAEMKKKCERQLQENGYMTMVTKELRDKVEDLSNELQMAQEDLDAMTSERDRQMKELLVHQKQTDDLCEQYHRRAASSDSLENLLSQKEVECSEYKEEIGRINRNLSAMQQSVRMSNEERELFKTQSEIYYKDFQDERQAREKLSEQNGTLTAQVAKLQEELIKFSRYAGQGNAYPGPGAAYPVPAYPEASQWMNYGMGGAYPYPNHSGRPSGAKEGARTQECPMCFERFADFLTLQRHVQQCSP